MYKRRIHRYDEYTIYKHKSPSGIIIVVKCLCKRSVNYRFLNDNVFWQNFEIHRYSSDLGFRIHHLSASNVHNRNVKIVVELNISLFKGKLTRTIKLRTL
jgi:hypothetical protein